MSHLSQIRKWSGLLAVLMILAFVISSCQGAVTSTPKGSTIITPSTGQIETTGKSNFLSAYGLAQKVAEAINDARQTAAIYQSIPDRQRPDIMLDDFVQYISLLRRSVTGTIAELSRIEPDELAAIIKDLHYSTELNHIGFRFYFKPVGRIADSCVFFMQQTDEGMPYLDRQPLAKALAIQNFSTLYFDAIDRYDRDALSVLVKSDADTREHRLLKADRILSFYRREIVTDSTSFTVERLTPDRIIFAQEYYISPDSTQTGTRLVTFMANGEEEFIIDDAILDELALDDLKVMQQDKTVFNISKLSGAKLPQITSSQVTGLLGRPLLHDDSTCSLQDDKTNHMIAYYDGLTIEGIGRCDNHQFWRVDLKEAILTDRSLSLGSGIAVGDSIESLLLAYPFLDETGYAVSRTIGDFRMTLQFDITDHQISQIRLSVTDR